MQRNRQKLDAASQVKAALWTYTLLLPLLTLASWITYWHTNDELARPLFARYDRFHDLTNYIGKTAHLYHGAAELGRGYPIFTYPAPAAFVYKAFLYAIPHHPVKPYLIFLALCVIGFALVAWKAVRGTPAIKIAAGAALVVTAALGFPTWITADRGNIEGVVWVLSGAGLCLLLRRRYLSGSVLIGAAAAVKPFSLVLLLLPVARRRFKQAGAGVATMCVLVVSALIYLGPNPLQARRDLVPGIQMYTARYLANLAPVEEERFDHSLLDTMKATALAVQMGGPRPHKAVGEVPRLIDEPGGWRPAVTLAQIYPLIALAAFAAIAAAFYKMPILNQLIALGVVTTLLPPGAGDYTLLHLYVPFGAFLVFLTRQTTAGTSQIGSSSMLAIAALFGFLLSPLSFLLLYSAPAKTLLLIALLLVAARTPMRSEYFGDPA